MCKIYRIICEGKNEFRTLKVDNQINAQENEKRVRVIKTSASSINKIRVFKCPYIPRYKAMEYSS